MHRRPFAVRAALCLVLPLLAGTASAVSDDIKPHAGMLRYPDVSATHIVFVYANDIWIVPRDGGTATPLASPPGQEGFPRFNADGSTIAFIGNYDGNRDLYTVPVTGGVPTRVTHHPAGEFLCDWTPDGRLLFSSNALAGLGRQTQLFITSPTGGLPEQLPVPYGTNAAISPDGKWLAYTPHSIDFRTWKRYRGGMQTDIWLFNLETYEWKQATDWEGTDTSPMWHGETLYYLADQGPEHRQNIWSYDPKTGKREQITRHADFDVKFPSIGPGERNRGEIVYQLGSSLMLLDLRNGRSRAVEVVIPGDRPRLRPQMIDAGRNMGAWGVSPTGKRAVVEARGDIWTVPAEKGPVRQMTDSSGAAERSPAWSPDGRWIAYFSDASGEYELWVRQSDGKDEPRQVTKDNKTFFFRSLWSPDSKKIIVTDKAANIILVDVETGEQRVLDRDEWANQPGIDWSHDSNWIAYAKTDPDSGTRSIWLYDLKSDARHQVTSGFFDDSNPVFSRKGDFLYYSSSRDFSNPQYEDVGTTFVYSDTGRLLAVPLNKDVKNPRLVESDEETWKKEEKKDEKKDDAEKDDAEKKDNGDAEGKKDDNGGNGDDDATKKQDAAPTSPIHGVWAGTVKGLSKIGAPQDEVEFTMTIIVAADGAITGSSSSMGQTNDYDAITFDEATGKFTATRARDGMTTKMEGTLAGDKLTGTWEVPELGINGTWEATKTDEQPPADAVKSADDKDKPLVIDLDGFEARAMQLPVSSGRFFGLSSNDKGELIYVRAGGRGTPPSIKIFDIRDEKAEEKTVIAGAGGYAVSADGKKLLINQGNRFGIVDARAGQSISKPLATELMKQVNPREEWEQIFTDAWRRHRDFFYVQNLHNVDWDAIYKQYHAMLQDAANREDVSYIIAEMISELNVGHAYYWGGDVEGQPSANVGLLGVDFELAGETSEDGTSRAAYRIKKIHEGAPWDSDARGPLSQPGVDAKPGTWILAVNGRPVDTAKDPWAAFIGLAGKHTTLTLADALFGDDEARKEREVTVTPVGSEGGLRFRSWIEANRRYVDERTSGKVGYIYVPNTGIDGQNELFRQFYGQTGKAALIIDERWNGGGQIPTRFIELLNRPRTNYWARRDGKDWPWPPDSHQGPKCMLINGLAGSGGDMFPWLFRHNGLGKLIGTRTWGGLVGISGVPGLIDGGYTAVPTFGFYETDGTWGVEGHGVDPDIEVIDDPSLMARGQDPQLDAAIDLMLQSIETNPYRPAPRPADPDRRGMGLPDSDK